MSTIIELEEPDFSATRERSMFEDKMMPSTDQTLFFILFDIWCHCEGAPQVLELTFTPFTRLLRKKKSDRYIFGSAVLVSSRNTFKIS